MKNSGGIFKNIAKYVLAIVVVLATIFGLTNSKSIVSFVKDYFSVGQEPAHEKKIKDNGNGTYNLSLSVTGDAEKQTQKVNVLVIVDRSGSMGDSSGQTTVIYTPTNSTNSGLYGLVNGQYVPLERRGYSGNRTFWYNGVQYTGQRYVRTTSGTRMDATKQALKLMAENLLEHNGGDNPSDAVELGLISFSNGQTRHITKTNDYDTFETAVNSINANGGTNWEGALQTAYNHNFGDSDPTFVIFFTDGAPTRCGNGYNCGTGSEVEPNMANSYNAAKDDAKTLAEKVGKDKFFTIFAYGEDFGATYLNRLTTESDAAGAPASNNYSASDTSALLQAFDSILNKIEMAGIGSVSIDDGTTSNVQTSTGLTELLKVDTTSYKYYRNGVEWKSTDTPAPPAATFENGHVKWDLSDLGVLENGVKYEVRFDVYPSQTTYDLIADLKNGTKTYSSLDPELKKYIVDNGGGSYSLRTNTTATLSYDDTRDAAGTQTKEYTNPDPVGTKVETISVEKIWENEIDSRKDIPVQLELKRDGTKIFDITLDGIVDTNIETEIQPGEETESWKASAISIATGLAKTVNGNLVVLDEGHDYTFGELGYEAYNWELEAVTVHPMIIDGVLTELTLVEDAKTCPSGSTCYTINGKLYKVSGNNPTITATNHRRSNINITKTVDGQSADPNQEFEFTIKIDQKDEKNQTIPSVDTENHNDYLWFSVQDSEGNWVDYGDTINGWVRYQGTDNLTGKTTYYYYAPNGSTAVVKLKDGYNVRYTNLVSNTDFTVSEKTVDNYVLDSITSNDDNTATDKINLTTKTINGKILNTNKSYNVEFKNVYELVDITVDKVWDDTTGDGIIPDSIDVTLLADGQPATVEDATVTLTEDEEGNWTYTWTGLDRFKNDKEITYDVQEITDSYVLAHYTSTKEFATIDDGDDETEDEADKQHVIITNTRIPEDITVNKSGTKTWSDNNDQDGMRPDSITVNLKGTITVKDPETGESVTKTVTLPEPTTKTVRADASGNWTYEFTNLPKYSEGVEIVYTATDTVEGYTATDNSMNITNTHIPSTIDISGNKQWSDDDNQDGIRPTSIQVTLTGTIKVLDPETGESVTKTVTLPEPTTKTVSANAEGKWLYTFEDVPQYNSGQEITYTVSEVVPDGYEATYPPRTYNIVNTHTSAVTDIEGIKTWDDNNDQDGIRPQSITVNLTGTIKVKNAETGVEEDKVVVTDSTTATAAGNWAYKFEGKPVKNSGKTITYTVTETAIDGYAASKGEGQYDIKNTHTPATTSVSGEKIWKDNNNQDGMRTNITVQLYANGTAVEGKTVQLPKADGSWTYSFTDLPEKANGRTIAYSVKEVTVPSGYSESYPEGTYNIENTHTPLTENVEGHKIWDDGEETDGVDQDGVRPGSIEITLYKSITVDGKTTKTEVETKTVTKDDSWSWSWKNLPQYENGNKITYTVEEGDVEYYTSEQEENTYNFKNTHVPFKAAVEVIKKWDDGNNQDGKRPATVTFVLKDSRGLMIPDAEGNTTITLNESNSWTFAKENLPRKSAGQDIEYNVTEISQDSNYQQSKPQVSKSTTEARADIKYTITVENKHTPGVVNVQGTKTWEDDNDRDRVRPTSITVNLTGTINYESESGTIVTEPVTISQETTKTVTAADGWSWSWTGLPEYSNGHEITYAVSETPVAGYEASAGKGQYDIVNTHNIKTTDVTIKKVWADDNNRDLLRPTQVLITLYANGVEYGQYPVSINNAINANEWELTIEDLPLNEAGQAITYTAQEKVTSETETDVPDGYTASYSGTTVTNTHTPEPTSISGKKVWEDDGDRDGTRPTSITINVYDADDYDENNPDPNKIIKQYVLEGSKDNKEWSYTITGLNKYKNVDGERKEINYVVDEVLPEGYTKSINGTTITNTYNTEKKNIPVSKTWVDEKGENYRPTSITVNLLADGVKVDETVLSDENEWKHTFENLPVNKNHGTGTVTYTVEEVETQQIKDYYDVTYPETGEDEGLVIVNTIKDLSKEIPVVKVWDDENNRDKVRPTSITFTLKGTVPNETDPVYKKSITISTADVDANDANRWVSKFTNVPIFHEGTWITYTVEESGVDTEMYPNTTNVTAEDGTITLTNSHSHLLKDIVASKAWDDNDDNDGKRPESVKITLYADGVEQETLEATEDTDWKVTFKNYPVNREGKVGEPIEYTVAETDENIPEGYEPSVDGYTITNSHEPATITYKVTKNWEDYDNNDGKRPDYITVRLVGKVGDTVVKEEVMDVYEYNEGFDEPWTYAFTNLPKYYNKQLVQYTLTEDKVDLYETEKITFVENTEKTTEITNEITNSHEKIPYNETGMITVNKYWRDEEDKYKVRPKSVTIELLADGEVIATADLTEQNEWSFTFENLPMYTIRDGEVGVEIVYSIRELPVEFYEATIDGFNVTNTYNGPEPEITPPDTGVMMVKDNNNSVLFEMIVTALAASYTIVVARRANEQ